MVKFIFEVILIDVTFLYKILIKYMILLYLIFPVGDRYPLKNIQQLDYADLRIAANLFKSNGKKSIETIKQIISYPSPPEGLGRGLNSNRE